MLTSHLEAMLLALALDVVIGWPAWLFARIGHPVSWLGRLIALGDAAFNRDSALPRSRRAAGAAFALGLIVLAAGVAWGIVMLSPPGWRGMAICGICAWPLLASRSLHDHVAAVAQPLRDGDLAQARRAVAMIVGRDPNRLDAAGVARAAAESLAENTSDGVVAPLLWGVVFGLPGIAAYKAINTMDSMIGHRTARHEAYGWAAARIDDVANLVPARLTGLLLAAVSRHPRAALAIMRRDAMRHRSPNAGWPEAAFAGALGIRLSGPRAYADRWVDEPWLNGSAADPDAVTLLRGLALYRRAIVVLAGLVLAGLMVIGAAQKWMA